VAQHPPLEGPDPQGSSPSPLGWVWTPDYEVDIGAHVFPTVKYRRVKERLVEEGILTPTGLREPEPATREELLAAHTPQWVETVLSGSLSPGEEQRLELPFSPALLHASRLCCGGTLLTARLALEQGVAVHLGGGFHHAFAGHGEGFCLLNDIAVAAAVLRRTKEVTRVAVVDLDVHHGNGTAAIFQDDSSVFTFSMHQERNYPLEKPSGDLDVGLEDGTGDEAYLALLETHLPKVLAHGPGLILYLAGADPYRDDQLGGLALTLEGLRNRDRLTLEMARRAGVPVAVTLAGGYAFRQDDTVEIHCGTIREAGRFVRTNEG
jgi:acetoin utilization deacetylase AcuC-like enzyme